MVSEVLSCPHSLPKIVDAFMFFSFNLIVFVFLFRVVLWTNEPRVHKSETPFTKQFSLKFKFGSLF